jgi:cyclophilin family peptidyl-prolyl cis-trans isomerase
MKDLRIQQVQKRRRQRRFLGALGAAVVIVIAIVVATSLGGSPHKPKKKTAAPSTTTSTTTKASPPVSVPLLDAPSKIGCPKLDGSSPHYTHFSSAPPMCINTSKDYTAKMVTDVGTVTIKLLAAQDPKTVNNFVFLAGYHFYDGTAFHRVVTGFMNQGGDPTGTGEGGPGYQFDGGTPKSASVYTAGAVAMANSGTSSSDGSQFFIVVGNGGKALQPLYSYFGQVTSGMSAVDKINADGSASEAGVPKVTHKVIRVTISEP